MATPLARLRNWVTAIQGQLNALQSVAVTASEPPQINAELLAVLKAVDREIEQTYDGSSAPRITIDIWNTVRAAIAKAEGR
jgi:hypothetical protein